ncbi:MBL fold metallo-hydrolase (plasmid) [Roseomonas sp. CCTCC AB2023176]|uniref:MBL fold metallo-hydrolase n=1 Tax=Roseomonas sp. CCTCC AB2023176 TaxID=3342640 RepID=UPI0035E12788
MTESDSAIAAARYRMTVGDFEITVLSDGFISVPGEVLVPEGAPEERAEVLAQLDCRDGAVLPKANIPLLRTGSDLIIVDIGAGRRYQPTDGQLASDMERAGIDPLSVTKVAFTHAHPDHVSATVLEGGGLRFPNATYYVGASEWEFWMDPDYLTRMPPALHAFAEGARRDLGAIRERVVLLRPGDDVVTGLRALETAGHTPGHLSFEVSGGEGLLITADVAVNEIVSFKHPDWPFGYDTLPDLAICARRRMLDRAATDRTRMLGYHWAYPGLGYAERRGNGFAFVGAG